MPQTNIPKGGKDLAKIGARSAGLSAGVGLVSNILSAGIQNSYNQHMYNRQRADYLSDRAHDEVYNSPALQKARMRNAGMNPLQFMGDPVASQSAENGSDLVPSASPDLSPLTSGISGIGQAYVSGELAQSSIVKNYADAEKTSTENGILQDTASDAVLQMRLRTDMTHKELAFMDSNLRYMAQNIRSVELRNLLTEKTIPLTVNLMNLDTELRKEELTSKRIENKWLDKNKSIEYKRAVEEFKNTILTGFNIKADTALKGASTTKVNSEVKTIELMRELDAKLVAANIACTIAQTGSISLDTALKGQEWYYNNQTMQSRIRTVEQDLKTKVREYKWMPVKNVASCFRDVAIGASGLVNTALNVFKTLPMTAGSLMRGVTITGMHPDYGAPAQIPQSFGSMPLQ